MAKKFLKNDYLHISECEYIVLRKTIFYSRVNCLTNFIFGMKYSKCKNRIKMNTHIVSKRFKKCVWKKIPLIIYWFLLFLYMQFSRKANWKYWSFTKLNGMLHKSTKDFCCSPLTFTCIMCDVTNCSTDDICVWENLRKNILQYSDDSLPCCCLLPEKSWKFPN